MLPADWVVLTLSPWWYSTSEQCFWFWSPPTAFSTLLLVETWTKRMKYAEWLKWNQIINCVHLLLLVDLLQLVWLLLVDFHLGLGNVLSLDEHLTLVGTQLFLLLFNYLVFEFLPLFFLVVLFLQLLVYDGLVSLLGSESYSTTHGWPPLLLWVQSLQLVLLHLLLQYIFYQGFILQIFKLL